MTGGDFELLNVAVRVCWSMTPRSLTDRLAPDN